MDKQDILCGNTSGNIAFFKNLGMAENGKLPKWAAPALIEVAEGVPFRVLAGTQRIDPRPLRSQVGLHQRLLRLIGMGMENSTSSTIPSSAESVCSAAPVIPLRVEPGVFDTGMKELPPKWQWWQTPACDTLTQWRTTPACDRL
jgi:hypothetical protein